MSYAEFRDWYAEEIERAALEWQRRAFAGDMPRLALWFKSGGLAVAAEKPGAEWEFAVDIPRSMTITNIRGFIGRNTSRLPIIPEESRP